MTNTEARSRPGGRSSRVRRAVYDAALEALENRGDRPLTIPEIAARAEVHPTSIYRRWGTVERLVVEAVLDQSEQHLPIPNTGLLRTDLVQFAEELTRYADNPHSAALLRALAATTDDDPEMEAIRLQFWENRMAAASTMVIRAIARGEAPDTTDPRRVLELLIAPIHFRTLLSHQPLDETLPSRLADAAIAAIGTFATTED